MRYEELVRDFAQRTISNLKIIDDSRKSGDPGAYEVTQAISALLGLVVFPAENRLRELIPILGSYSEYQLLQSIMANSSDHKTYSGDRGYSFLELMRNAISHCNIRMVNSERDISSVVFWNCPRQPYSEERADWRVSIKAENITKLCYLLASAINEHYLSTLGGNP